MNDKKAVKAVKKLKNIARSTKMIAISVYSIIRYMIMTKAFAI